MSFHFNPSSDEEEEEEEDLASWNRRDHAVPAAAAAVARSPLTTAAAATSFLAEEPPWSVEEAPNTATNNNSHNSGGIWENDFDKALVSNDFSSSDEEESIDWQDADDDDDAALGEDRKPASVDANTASHRLRQVTVNLGEDKGQDKEPPKKKRKLRSRKRFRADTLPRNVQALLYNLHYTHLLTLTAQAMIVSQRANEDPLLALGLSMVPPHHHDDNEATNNNPPTNDNDFVVPTLKQLQRLCEWYSGLVHGARLRRQARLRENRAAGAPIYRHHGGQRGRQRGNNPEVASLNEYATSTSTAPATPRRLELYTMFLSHSTTDDPRFREEVLGLQDTRWTQFDQNQLFLSVVRSLGWRARFVLAMDPINCDLDVHHPLLTVTRNIFQVMTKKKQENTNHDVATPQLDEEKLPEERPKQMCWIEVLCRDARSPQSKLRWIHVDPSQQLFNQPNQVEILLRQVLSSDNRSTKRSILAYAIAVEHSVRGVKFTDVTPRYAHSFVASLRHRGLLRGRDSKKQLSTEQLRKTWWGKTVLKLNAHFYQAVEKQKAEELKSQGTTIQDAIAIDDTDDETESKKPVAINMYDKADEAEKEELKESALNEAVPTSKAAFQTHPVYVIKSVLGNAEVLAPDASKRVCGMFKGQMVYRRTDVSTAHPARKWPYLGRKVRKTELNKPIKQVKARKKPVSKGFKALKSYGVGESNDGSADRRLQDIEDAVQPLEDDMDKLYAIWQTDPWSPAPVSPTDPIPVNEYKNVELELMNPGLVHLDYRGIAKVAKKLGVPYAPCMLGFEGQGGNRVPTIRGIVVHAHNEMLLREAGAEVTSHALEQENSSRRKMVLKRWKKLIVGLLTKERIEREYGDAK